MWVLVVYVEQIYRSPDKYTYNENYMSWYDGDVINSHVILSVMRER